MKYSTAAIIFIGNRYMFQKRDNKKEIFYPGFYGLFGGENNKNEKPIDCIKRELSEEININFKNINYFMTLHLKSKIFDKKKSSIFERHFFICNLPKNYKKELKILEGKGYVLENINKIKKNNTIPFDSAITEFYHLLRNKKKIIPKKFLVDKFTDFLRF